MYVKTAQAVLALLQMPKGEKKAQTVVFIILLPVFLFLIIIACIMQFLQSPALWGGIDYNYLLEQIEDSEYTGDDFTADDIILNFNGKLIMPCEQSRITSDYGLRVHPIDKVIRKHTGIDFGTPWHSNIYAVAPGVVYQTKVDNIYGRNITIKHEVNGQTLYSFYAHLSASHVSVGDAVSAGQVIAQEGGQPGKDTGVGKSTGHHLHFEIRTAAASTSNVDPKKYLGGFIK